MGQDGVLLNSYLFIKHPVANLHIFHLSNHIENSSLHFKPDSGFGHNGKEDNSVPMQDILLAYRGQHNYNRT